MKNTTKERFEKIFYNSGYAELNNKKYLSELCCGADYCSADCRKEKLEVILTFIEKEKQLVIKETVNLILDNIPKKGKHIMYSDFVEGANFMRNAIISKIKELKR